MVMVKKRRIEIIAFERERIVRRPVLTVCPVCLLDSEMLKTQDAASLIQVRPKSLYRWLAEGKVHGLRTPGGSYRFCRNSLFTPTECATELVL